MNLGLQSKRNEQSEQNQSEIRISLEDQTNAGKIKSENVNTLLNELKIIGSNHIPKGSQLNRFEFLISNISEFITKQQSTNDLLKKKLADSNVCQRKKPQNYFSSDQNLRSTLEKQMAQVKPKRPFMRQGFSAKGKLPQSLKKRDKAQQNAEQIIDMRTAEKQGAKYTRFIPTLRARSPEPQSVTIRSQKQVTQE